MTGATHSRTPTLRVTDPRGLTVRQVDYCRDMENVCAEVRIQRQRFDLAGHGVEHWDPRLWALSASGGPANSVSVHALGGREVTRNSVDAGECCTLFGPAGQPVFSADGNGNQRQWEYDDQVRPLALFETPADQPAMCSERWEYANSNPVLAPDNACGRLVRHDDPAGSRLFLGYSLAGQLAAESRRLLFDDQWPDWPKSLPDRDALLEPEEILTRCCHGPLGDVHGQVDGAGNRRLMAVNVAGQLRDVRVQLAEAEVATTVLESARYDAFGHVEEEVLGNGVVVRHLHRPEDGRLERLCSRRVNGDLLQDLRYACDPAGNVVSIEDRLQPTRHFANQRIDPICRFRHDSLYQLVEATGWESGAVRRGPDALLDPGAVANYRQHYQYDAGGNLLRLVHVGAQGHGRVLVTAPYSNRCLAEIDGQPPTEDDYRSGFDANGNPLQLGAGQVLEWDVRNQLRQVRPVRREGAKDDQEVYRYDGGGQRIRKRRSWSTSGRVLTDEVRYLPGLERHGSSANGERFDVLVVQLAACSVRLLHWHHERPTPVPQDHHRYQLGDHLGSCSLELDAEAALISREGYYPFGETAWYAARNEVEAGYRTLRYCAKERDASGLYYYGARYYRADWQRWLNPDPAGPLDGLNLYRMVGNAPVNRRDPNGCWGYDVLDDAESQLMDRGSSLLASGLDQFPADMQGAVRDSFTVARGMLNNTIAALGGGADEQVNRALHATFGITDTRPTAARQELLGSLQSVLRESHDYLANLEQQEGWRLLLTHTRDRAVLATTGLSASRGVRLSLETDLLRHNRLDRAMTIAHESLHAMTLPLLSVSPVDVVADYWYSVLPVSRAGSMPAMLEHLYRSSTAIVANGPSEDSMTARDRFMYGQLMKREAARFGLIEPRSPEQRRDYFTTHAGVRQAVVMRNADSVSGLVLMLQRRGGR